MSLRRPAFAAGSHTPIYRSGLSRAVAGGALAAAVFTGIDPLTLSSVPSFAAEIPYENNFSNVKVDDSGLTDKQPNKQMQTNQRAALSFDFAVPDSAQPGDTFTITLSPGFAFNFNGTLEITTKDGSAVIGSMKANLSEDKTSYKSATITLSDAVSGLESVTGTVDVPVGPSRMTDPGIKLNADNPLFLIVGGQKIDTGKSYFLAGPVNIRDNGTIMYATVNAETKNLTINPVAILVKSDKKEDKTFTYEAGPNWVFNTSKPVASITADTNTTVANNPDKPEQVSWEFPFSGSYEVISATAKKVVIKVKDIPAGQHVRVSMSGVATKIDGQPYSGTATFADGAKKTASVDPNSISGIADAKPAPEPVEEVAAEDPPTVAPDPKIDLRPKLGDDEFVSDGNPITVTSCEPGKDVTFTVTKRGDENVRPFEQTVKADEDGTAVFAVKGLNADEPSVYRGMYDVTAACGDHELTAEFEVYGDDPAPETPAASPEKPAGMTEASLPRTGPDGALAAGIAGAVLLSIGGATIYLTRRKGLGLTD